MVAQKNKTTKGDKVYSKNTLRDILWLTIILSLVALSVSVSLWFEGENSAVLNAGAYPSRENIDRLILTAAEMGDYDTAKSLYAKVRVLGISNNNTLEMFVYPERYRAQILNKYEEFLLSNPYYWDGLVGLSRMYDIEGNKFRAQELLKEAMWVDPSL